MIPSNHTQILPLLPGFESWLGAKGVIVHKDQANEWLILRWQFEGFPPCGIYRKKNGTLTYAGSALDVFRKFLDETEAKQ